MTAPTRGPVGEEVVGGEVVGEDVVGEGLVGEDMVGRDLFRGPVGRGPVGRDAVEAEVHVVAEADAGRTRLVTMRSAFPVALRRTGPSRVHLVGTGAWPLGGDRVRFTIEVGPGATLDLAAVAASVALPGRSGRPSEVHVTVVVGAGGHLRLDLGPTIVAAGADHRASVDVRVEAGGRVALRELVIRGRERETGGRIEQQLDVTHAGLAVVRERSVRPDPIAPSFTDGGSRVVGSVLSIGSHHAPERPQALVVEPAMDGAAEPDMEAAVLSLPRDAGGWRAIAVGEDVAALDQWIAARWALA